MLPSTRPLILRYGIAIAAIAAAMAVILVIPGLYRGPFTVLAAASVFSAWYGGMRAGMVAMLLSTLSIIWLLMMPDSSFNLSLNFFIRLTTYYALIVFVMMVLHHYSQASARLAEERERIQIANEQFEGVIQAAPLGIVVFDREGQVRLWGPAAERITGYREAEVIGKVPPAIPPERVSAFHEMLDSAAREEGIVALETVYQRKEGRLIDVNVSTAALHDQQGKVTGFITILDDITTKKRTQMALRSSERHLRKVLDSLFAYVGVLTPDGVLIEVNRAALDAANLRAEEVLGMVYWETYWWAWSPDVQRHIQSAIEEGAQGFASRFDLEMRIAEDRYLVIDFMLSPMQDEQGKVTHLVPSAIDITERKKEEQLKAQLQAITAALSMAITPQEVARTVSTQVNQTLKAAFTTIVTLTESQQEVEILHTTGLADALRDRYRRVPLKHPGALTQAILRNEPIWVETQDEYIERFPGVANVIKHETNSHATACLPLRAGDRVLGGLGITFSTPRKLTPTERSFLTSAADATSLALERARLYEAEGEARRAAERANFLKTRFLAIVSHELRTPLTSIKGFATTLLQDDVEWDAESQRDFIQIIDAESDKLAEMIEHLLDFSRIEAGTLRIERERTTVSEIFEFVLPQVHVLTEQHTLEMDFSIHLPPVHADRRRIGQVITNVVVNAARYSPPGSAIRIQAYVEKGHVRFDISDNGPGIPSEDRAAVFEAFQQGRNRAYGEGKGAGLGLAIAKGLIAAHEGKIWVDDRDAPGTTISFVLPVDLSVDEGDSAD